MERGERVCLLGRNGEGKSTLLRLVEGVIEPDDGQVIRQQGLRVARLAQEVPEEERRGWRQVAEIEGPLTESGVQRASYTEDRDGERNWFDGKEE